MKKQVTLLQGNREAYEEFFESGFDCVYEIRNEKDQHIGIIFLSDMLDGSVYIEWLELLTCFQRHGYLRYIFAELRKLFPDKKIQLQSSDNNIQKYTKIGCKTIGIDECTELTILEY